MPHERLLVIQTDAILAKPLHPFFFNFSYLGLHSCQSSTPNMPARHRGNICRFFKTDSPIHGSPDRDVYPHLHGNGGLSIRSKTAMQTICEYWGKCSPDTEGEDVFFSRHIQGQHTSSTRDLRLLPRKRHIIQMQLVAMPVGNSWKVQT